MSNFIDIPGFEGKYSCSKEGVVKNNTKGIFLKQSNSNGYLVVSLFKDDRWFTLRVHRLVAMTFMPNPNNYPIINHIDCNKRNNNVVNLEWCTYSHNMYHAVMKGIHEEHYRAPRPHLYKPVSVTKDGVTKEFPSVKAAVKETGATLPAACACLRGRYKTAGGYTWKFTGGQ